MSKKDFLAIIGVAVLFLLLLVTVVTAAAFTSHPSFCKSCHVMRDEYQSWRSSSHKNVGCFACHQDPGIAGFIIRKFELAREFTLWATNLYQRPITAQVKNESCIRCHRNATKKILSSQGIKVSHKEFLSKGQLCTDCHNTVAHGKIVPVAKLTNMDKCVTCHDGKIASKQCKVCHTTKVERTRARNVNSIWAITHGVNWRKTHGMGNLATCLVCHPQDYCVDCHGPVELPHSASFRGKHGKIAKENRGSCLKCHNEGAFCSSCHGLEMPHPRLFLMKHPEEVAKKGWTSCLRCHLKFDCRECHERHTHPGLAPEQLKELRGK